MRSVKMTLQEAIEGLTYIADSPPREHGGFHPQAVGIAKAALHYLKGDGWHDARKELPPRNADYLLFSIHGGYKYV